MKDNRPNIPNPAFNQQYDFEVIQDIKKDNISEKYTFAEITIGKSRRKYIEIFKKIAEGKLIIPSFKSLIFGFNWLIYRRATYYTILPYILMIALSYNLISKITHFPLLVKFILIISIPHLILFFIGNLLYWYSVRKKITSYRKQFGDASALTYLSEKGGVLTGSTLIATIIMIQGSIILCVYLGLYIDDFLITLWEYIKELTMINKL